MEKYRNIDDENFHAMLPFFYKLFLQLHPRLRKILSTSALIRI